MSKRWATLALCTLAVPSLILVSAPAALAATPNAGALPPLTLSSQSPWVTPTQPWFSLNLHVGSGAGPVSALHVDVTVYSRIGDTAQLQQATSSVPDKEPLTRTIDVPVTDTTNGLVAKTCITVLPNTDATTPTPAAGDATACPADAPVAYLDCTLDAGVCGDVYPVSVALIRRGSSTPVTRFSTFLTYVEPGDVGGDGSLRVGWVEPLSSSSGGDPTVATRATSQRVINLMADHHNVALTVAMSPALATALASAGGKAGRHARNQLNSLVTAPGPDQLLDQPYVPISVAALSGAGLGGEIETQVNRGDTILRAASLHPTMGTWVDTTTNLTASNADNLANGLSATRSNRLVLNDSDLATAGSESLTFAQTFSLSLGHNRHITAVAADSQLDARFSANKNNPVLSANQLLAALAFVHFENVFKTDPRGVVIEPPASWQPSTAFIATMLNGLDGNPALTAVTLDDFFAQVPKAGNGEPATRHLQSGPAPKAISTADVARIAQDRDHLGSFSSAAGHPSALTPLSDLLLSTENRFLSPKSRGAALDRFTDTFDTTLGAISLATERTVTFTSRTAAIPITVLSSAPYPITVVLTLSSDKFTFPDGSTRTLHLSRPTTPVRIEARSRTSGDRLPVSVTLRTPDGVLLIAKTVVGVHSTSISLVGIGLTVLAGAVLLVWWGRTWWRGRRRRPRST